ncbi:MAG TPA: hypothetical protein PKY41_05595 [Bacteroidales bacterium]|nr:hypothetical protein [Bacteroidales bacterium]
MKKAVDDMYSVFRTLTPINADDQNDKPIIIPSGKAISPSTAAHCLLEMKRTALFLRGINKAIRLKKIKNKKNTISILYAGTGPYATLITPLFFLYNSDEIKVDLLDINPISLDSARKVISGLNCESYIDEVYFEDASVFKINKNYDIVISETMQAALKNEPQVAIMQNLISQLDDDAIFIPQEISISAEVVSRGKWNPVTYIFDDIEKMFLGELFIINKNNLNTSAFKKKFFIPCNLMSSGKYLKLNTRITVFADEVLIEGDSSLNIPQKICELNYMQSKVIEFIYEQGVKPGFRHQIIKSGVFQYNNIGN